jgi:hypothetical protein
MSSLIISFPLPHNTIKTRFHCYFSVLRRILPTALNSLSKFSPNVSSLIHSLLKVQLSPSPGSVARYNLVAIRQLSAKVFPFYVLVVSSVMWTLNRKTRKAGLVADRQPRLQLGPVGRPAQTTLSFFFFLLLFLLLHIILASFFSSFLGSTYCDWKHGNCFLFKQTWGENGREEELLLKVRIAS